MIDGVLVSVDPGVRAAGVALFVRGKLSRAFLASGADLRKTAVAAARWVQGDHGDMYVVDRLVVETPQVYVGARLKGDPNDLVDVAVGGGVVCGLLSPVRVLWPRPAEWKGQAPKQVIWDRVESRLEEDERRALAAALETTKGSLRHNVVDAVGIGLWALGRFDKRR